MIKAEDNINLVSGQATHEIASNTAQHFWNMTTGTDTGVHITEKTKDDFIADPANGGKNLLARSNGIAIRDGTTEVATFSANAIELGKNSTTAEVKLCNDALKITGEVDSGVSIVYIDNTTSTTGKDTTMRVGNDSILRLHSYNEQYYPSAGFNIGASKGNRAVYIDGTATANDDLNTRMDLYAGDASITLYQSTTDIASPHVMIGGRLVVDGALIKNQYGYDNTTTGAPNMHITSNGYIRRTTNVSSQRYKHDIDEVKIKELDPHRLYDVEVKQFKYNDDVITDKNDCRYGKDMIGFIAEQVKEVYPIAVDINEDGECETWNIQYIIPPMLMLIQEQHKQIEDLTKRIEALERATK